MFSALTILLATIFAGALSCAMGVVVRAQNPGSLSGVEPEHEKNRSKQIRFISNGLFGFGALNIAFGLLLYAAVTRSSTVLINLSSFLLLESMAAMVFFFVKGIQRHQAKPAHHSAPHARR